MRFNLPPQRDPNAGRKSLFALAYFIAWALLASLFLLQCANARDTHLTWTRVVSPGDDVAITVHHVTTREMRAVMREHGHRPARGLSTRDHGFAVLRSSNSRTTWTCDIYLGPHADDTVLAHEHRHCAGWVHT